MTCPVCADYLTPLDRCPALVLNADFRPLSHYPPYRYGLGKKLLRPFFVNR
jgi:hypothetical protein